mmetsp:Transcript_59235/g.152429  ORF Transcript_59235/g.152429 Transcript_59235/m.152429 type:complete len:306 (+) Transcript_59235:1663-2580(+)
MARCACSSARRCLRAEASAAWLCSDSLTLSRACRSASASSRACMVSRALSPSCRWASLWKADASAVLPVSSATCASSFRRRACAASAVALAAPSWTRSSSRSPASTRSFSPRCVIFSWTGEPSSLRVGGSASLVPFCGVAATACCRACVLASRPAARARSSATSVRSAEFSSPSTLEPSRSEVKEFCSRSRAIFSSSKLTRRTSICGAITASLASRLRTSSSRSLSSPPMSSLLCKTRWPWARRLSMWAACSRCVSVAISSWCASSSRSSCKARNCASSIAACPSVDCSFEASCFRSTLWSSRHN